MLYGDRIASVKFSLAERLHSTIQSKAAQISADTAQQTLIASQRAWLGPSHARFDTAPVVGKKLGISIMYHNTGREPARNVNLSVQELSTLAVSDEVAEETLKMHNREFLRGCLDTKEYEDGWVVYPSSSSSNVTFFKPSSANYIDEDVVNGKSWLFIQGCFVYRTFDKVRHSTFCYFYKSGVTTHEHLSICPGGNYAD